MGVYIKGMEMPTSCSVCKLFGEYGCPFIGAVGYALTRGERSDDCPLVEVPPHGRLIDADALAVHKFVCVEHDISNADGGACYRRGWNDAVDAIMVNAPTIISVEKDMA